MTAPPTKTPRAKASKGWVRMVENLCGLTARFTRHYPLSLDTLNTFLSNANAQGLPIVAILGSASLRNNGHEWEEYPLFSCALVQEDGGLWPLSATAEGWLDGTPDDDEQRVEGEGLLLPMSLTVRDGWYHHDWEPIPLVLPAHGSRGIAKLAVRSVTQLVTLPHLSHILFAAHPQANRSIVAAHPITPTRSSGTVSTETVTAGTGPDFPIDVLPILTTAFHSRLPAEARDAYCSGTLDQWLITTAATSQQPLTATATSAERSQHVHLARFTDFIASVSRLHQGNTIADPWLGEALWTNRNYEWMPVWADCLLEAQYGWGTEPWTGPCLPAGHRTDSTGNDPLVAWKYHLSLGCSRPGDPAEDWFGGGWTVTADATAIEQWANTESPMLEPLFTSTPERLLTHPSATVRMLLLTANPHLTPGHARNLLNDSDPAIRDEAKRWLMTALER